MDLRDALREETVGSIGHRELVTVPTTARTRDAVDLMREHEVGCLCVLKGEELVGIFTERDLAVRVFGGGGSLDDPVSEHMTHGPVTVRADEPVHTALARMHAGGFRHIPVFGADGRPLGTVSVKRAVHFLADHLPKAILNLPPHPDVYPATQEGG